jgi:hypothetical protein
MCFADAIEQCVIGDLQTFGVRLRPEDVLLKMTLLLATRTAKGQTSFRERSASILRGLYSLSVRERWSTLNIQLLFHDCLKTTALSASGGKFQGPGVACGCLVRPLRASKYP